MLNNFSQRDLQAKLILDLQATVELNKLKTIQQTRRSSAEASGTWPGGSGAEVSKPRRRGSTLYLQRWMTQLPESEEMDPPEPDMEITVRTSPIVVDTIPVCRQCHKKCLSKPNSPMISQKKLVIPTKTKAEMSSQTLKSHKSTQSICSANCTNRKPRFFCKLERKGAIKIIRPEDAPMAALRAIDSIEQSQKMLKSTSYDLKTDSPILSRSTCSINRSHLEAKKEAASLRTPSPSSSSRNNSPLSTSHTTCSSMVFNSSTNDLRTSNSNIPNTIQCVIAQEKYLNEIKHVENITISKNNSPASLRKEMMTRQKAENVLNKVLGMNIITRRNNVGSCMKTSAVFLDDDSAHEDDADSKKDRVIRRSPKMGISAVTKMNGDIKKLERLDDVNANTKSMDASSDEDLELGPLMLMGLSAINPAAHLMRVEPFKRGSINSINPRPSNTNPTTKNEPPVPNISVAPPTPDYNSVNKTDELLDDSPDSPLPEDPPYVTLKRYGTMSSLERIPSDETDDGSGRPSAHDADARAHNPVSGAAGSFMGWTARAGSFVVEKMNIFSYTESVPTSALAHKQPSFLERCLGVSDWRNPVTDAEVGGDTGEGSAASGEEAWGTPSSGDLSDNLPDSEHGTLSSPTKSSSSYAGDDDTELMMDELLMAPTITGPTTLRPLLPRRRLEPLLEEDYSDSSSEDNKPTPTNPENQVAIER
ncbi:hypothetical protein EVAR_78804_1 [Eumeta japonica]|uniref:Uncharacterized protein n=1 Tax=Eumeta variegata TaxID=151549 RepID=A0A4C1T1D6_EUMVA|nr:hypothetical protein EVAR_78804_1 [Eumeta japonica]